MVKRFGPILTIFLLASFNRPQEKDKYPFDQWDDATKKKAHAYSEEDKVPDLEKMVLFYTNLARLNPKLFAKTYAQQYLDDHELKSSYTSSLIRELTKAPKMEALKFNKDLYYCAKAHAESNGKKGLEGHQNYNARFKKYASQFSYNGENCDYGNNEALDIVMSLLIDEDVPNLGHRRNILDKSYKHLGLSYAPHKVHAHNFVMCFGG